MKKKRKKQRRLSMKYLLQMYANFGEKDLLARDFLALVDVSMKSLPVKSTDKK